MPTWYKRRIKYDGRKDYLQQQTTRICSHSLSIMSVTELDYLIFTLSIVNSIEIIYCVVI